MKRNVMLMVVMALFYAGGTVHAGFGNCGTERGAKAGRSSFCDKECEKMIKRLKLLPDQAVQFKAIMQAHRAKKEQLQKEHQAHMQILRDEVRGQLNGVLTPQQMSLWEASVKKEVSPVTGGSGGVVAHHPQAKICPVTGGK